MQTGQTTGTVRHWSTESGSGVVDAHDVAGRGHRRRLTERIRLTAISARESIEKLQVLVTAAREGNAHLALGCDSWTAYLAAALGAEPLRLPRDQRQGPLMPPGLTDC